jgi:methionine synthase II (cobalamin-independent)
MSNNAPKIVAYAMGDLPRDGDDAVVQAVADVAKARDLPNAQVALAWMLQREAVTAPNISPPEAVGEISYVEPGISPECKVFREALQAQSGAFTEAFMTAPAPGLIALAMRNAHYESEQSYLDALAATLRVEYSKIAEGGFVLQIDSPDLGMERSRTYHDRPLSDFLDFAERAVSAINSAIGVPVVTCSARRSSWNTPDRMRTESGSLRWLTNLDWPGLRRSR